MNKMALPSYLQLPTRVSRVYPLLTLVLMIASSSAVYAWQYTQLMGDTAVRERELKIQELTLQVSQLSDQSKLDRAAIKSQREQIAQISSQLQTLESQLGEKTQQLKDAENQLEKQKSQLSTNASELEKLRNRPPLFSFQNRSALPDIEAKKAAVREVVTDAYDYIVELYGRPYLLSKVTITFVNSFSIAGAAGEIEISNGPNGISIDIRIQDFDRTNFAHVNTILHEIVHSFRGVAVLDSSALEEGSTVAATDIVMARMIKDGKLPNYNRLYLIINEAHYQDLNKKLHIKADNSAFYSDPLISKAYQLVGTAWMKLYNEDKEFFRKFNDAYYARVQRGQTVDVTGVHAIIASIIPSVGGVPINQYLSENRAFNPN
jgi:hypothetical protein